MKGAELAPDLYPPYPPQRRVFVEDAAGCRIRIFVNLVLPVSVNV